MEEERKEPITENTEEERIPSEQAETLEEFQSLIRGKYQQAYLAHVSRLLAAQAADFRRYARYQALRRDAETLGQTYPDFCLEKELEDPAFARLIANGVELRTAYEVIHRDALEQARETRARSEAHPRENGLEGGSQAAVTRPDPRALTPKERRQLRRRAARGEEIVW